MNFDTGVYCFVWQQSYSLFNHILTENYVFPPFATGCFRVDPSLHLFFTIFCFFYLLLPNFSFYTPFFLFKHFLPFSLPLLIFFLLKYIGGEVCISNTVYT
jgi:hypothetical protein